MWERYIEEKKNSAIIKMKGYTRHLRFNLVK